MSAAGARAVRWPAAEERCHGPMVNDRGLAVAAGHLLKRVHHAAWRPSPVPLDLSIEEVATMLPALVASGSVGLVWPRLRHGRLGAVGAALEELYRDQRARERSALGEVAAVMRRFELAGVEPVLVKGWTLSRLYPEPAVRPSGDIDVIVPAAQHARAASEQRRMHAGGFGYNVDLQRDDAWHDRPSDTFRQRLDTLDLGGGVSVRTLGPEDQLRLLCLHMLRHDARRPLWLTDIALMLETRPARFDWARCLGEDGIEAGWIATTLQVAHHMVGADLSGTPLAVRDATLPRWLEPEILRQWERGDPILHEVVPEIARDPKEVVSVFRRRWPSPISATVACRLPFTDMPRLPVQLVAYGKTIGGFVLWRFPGQVAEVRRDRRRQDG